MAQGTACVSAAINLALALGLVGRVGSGYGPVTGQGNEVKGMYLGRPIAKGDLKEIGEALSPDSSAVLLLLEDVLSGMGGFVGDHWQLFIGLFLVLVVLFAKRGLAGLLPGAKPHD